MASGGAVSPADELAATQYTLDELRAAVEEAEAAGTYVMAHAYNDRSVRNCLQSGVRSIEHGNLIDEETAASSHAREPTWCRRLSPTKPSRRKEMPSGCLRTSSPNRTARGPGHKGARYAYEAGAKIKPA